MRARASGSASTCGWRPTRSVYGARGRESRVPVGGLARVRIARTVGPPELLDLAFPGDERQQRGREIGHRERHPHAGQSQEPGRTRSVGIRKMICREKESSAAIFARPTDWKKLEVTTWNPTSGNINKRQAHPRHGQGDQFPVAGEGVGDLVREELAHEKTEAGDAGGHQDRVVVDPGCPGRTDGPRS